MKKIITLILVLGMPVAASAQVNVEQLQQRVRELQEQIRALQNQQRQAIAELARNLARGSTGEDVSSLQAFLGEQPGIYPEKLVTGFYGVLTEQAVRRFQQFHGIEPVGIVGPITRETINGLKLAKAKIKIVIDDPSVGGSGTTPTSTPPTGDTSTSTPPTPGRPGKITICHIPPGNRNARHTISVGAPAVTAHLGHGDTLGACAGDDGQDDGDNQDTTAPVISNVAATSTTMNSTHITWTTNEPANSRVYYSTTTPVVATSTTPNVFSASLVSDHDLTLTGLTASTTYYFTVESTDAADNTRTSAGHSFTTTN